jgi:hypothetical protein
MDSLILHQQKFKNSFHKIRHSQRVKNIKALTQLNLHNLRVFPLLKLILLFIMPIILNQALTNVKLNNNIKILRNLKEH